MPAQHAHTAIPSAMVEKAARAAYNAKARNKPFDQLPAFNREVALSEALAALSVAGVPGMLAALELALPVLEDEADQRETSGIGEYSEPVRKAAEAVRAAIALAKGES